MNHAETEQIERQAHRREVIAALAMTAIEVLNERLLTLLVLLLDGGIFAWAISTESIIRLVGAVLFAGAAQLLVHWRPKKGEPHET
jgi:hypothetical protein